MKLHYYEKLVPDFTHQNVSFVVGTHFTRLQVLCFVFISLALENVIEIFKLLSRLVDFNRIERILEFSLFRLQSNTLSI